MKTVADILERVEAELAVGRAWRAKEILAGNIASGSTDPAILERYGRLLDVLGDRVEAGKYLYLSGVRRPEYEHSIALFLQRHARLDGPALVARLPNAVRRTPFNELPPAVQADLDRRGVRHASFGIRSERRPAVVRGWTDTLVMVLAVVVMLFFFAALAVGGWQVTEWVWTIFR
jgi:hypothetical protein